MSNETIQEIAQQEYKYGFVTDIEADVVPPGLNEDIVRTISAKKGEPEWMLEWRLKAYRHWLTMKEPTWANVHYAPIDYQATSYYSAPKQKKKLNSLDEVDPELLKRRSRSSASRSKSRSGSPASPSTRCSTASRWRRRSRRSSRRWASSSARSPRR